MPARYACTVLEEMRALSKTKNFSPLDGLVEELQIICNRMEATLEEKKDYNYWHDKCKTKKTEHKELEEKLKILEKKKKDLS